MPAAAVIPAPIAYIKVVAVKKLVVEVLACLTRFLAREIREECVIFFINLLIIYLTNRVDKTFTLKKLECLKQAYA